MLAIFQLTSDWCPNVCCMKESTVASDGRFTDGPAAFSGAFAAVEVCAATIVLARKSVRIRLTELRIGFLSTIMFWDEPCHPIKFALLGSDHCLKLTFCSDG